ncbi:unnamed protein product [Musa acuminata var. zebrina]
MRGEARRRSFCQVEQFDGTHRCDSILRGKESHLTSLILDS